MGLQRPQLSQDLKTSIFLFHNLEVSEGNFPREREKSGKVGERGVQEGLREGMGSHKRGFKKGAMSH